MNNKKNYKKGTRLDIIETIHMTSIMPIKALNVMDTPRTYKDKHREMEDEELKLVSETMSNTEEDGKN